MIYLDWGNEGGDPYWGNVSLLIQDGTAGTTLIQDRSSYGGSVTATANASWSAAHQVHGNNTIAVTSIGPSIPAFTSSGAGSRFTRDSGEELTVEVYFYYSALSNISTSLPLFWWVNSIHGSIVELYLQENGGRLAMRQNSGAIDYFGFTSSSTLHFVQLTVSGNTYYLDVDGTQVGTGTFTSYNSTGTYSVYACASSVTSSSGGSTQAWVSPFRWTKGVARARGSVPSSSFPTN